MAFSCLIVFRVHQVYQYDRMAETWTKIGKMTTAHDEHNSIEISIGAVCPRGKVK